MEQSEPVEIPEGDELNTEGQTKYQVVGEKKTRKRKAANQHPDEKAPKQARNDDESLDSPSPQQTTTTTKKPVKGQHQNNSSYTRAQQPIAKPPPRAFPQNTPKTFAKPTAANTHNLSAPKTLAVSNPKVLPAFTSKNSTSTTSGLANTQLLQKTPPVFPNNKLLTSGTHGSEKAKSKQTLQKEDVIPQHILQIIRNANQSDEPAAKPKAKVASEWDEFIDEDDENDNSPHQGDDSGDELLFGSAENDTFVVQDDDTAEFGL